MKLVIDIDKKAFDYIMACSFVEDEAVVLNQSLEDRIKTLMFFDVLNAIKIGTPIDSIITDIEAARDKDKLCEYPYNRCIDIINKNKSAKTCKTCFCEDYNKNLYPCCECNRNHNRSYDKWSAKVE